MPAPPEVITFLIRRLIATVFLLVVVSMITFAIFFLVPRLAGQSTYQLAVQYVGRNPQPSAVRELEVKLGFNLPLPVQYWHFLRGIVAGAHYDAGPNRTYCPPPCFGYSFRNQQPVWPQMVSDIPVTASLAVGAAVLWLIGGVSIGVLSALKRGIDLRPLLDGRRAGRSVAADLLHRPDRPGVVQLQVADLPQRSVRARSPRIPICGRGTWCCPGSRWPSSMRRSTPG